MIFQNPDKADLFKDINRAYEILSNEEKKATYDKYGEKGLSNSNQQQKKRQKGRDVVHQLRVTLEELYNGTKKKLSLNRKELCKTCDGRGGLVSSFSRLIRFVQNRIKVDVNVGGLEPK